MDVSNPIRRSNPLPEAALRHLALPVVACVLAVPYSIPPLSLTAMSKTMPGVSSPDGCFDGAIQGESCPETMLPCAMFECPSDSLAVVHTTSRRIGVTVLRHALHTRIAGIGSLHGP
ncbi:MAG: hypothetical protein ACYTHJ_01225 [Planctomycetota bacterium]|jgi:hypothetical protein